MTDLEAPGTARSTGTAGERFDTFYRRTRDRLLLQTYALTGDLGVARSAVRDAFVVAWHRWRKLSRLDDPEMVVRPHAWRIALRRAGARPWHRDRRVLDPDSRRTIDALTALPVLQRRALLLSQLAAVSMPELARELALPTDQAERELQAAVAQFSIARDIPAAAIPTVFRPLEEVTKEVVWPRVTIIRRAGTARRRAHTVVGAVTVVAALLAGGWAVNDPAGVRPTLTRQQVAAPPSVSVPPDPQLSLPDTGLLPVDGVRQAIPGRWVQGRTTDNSTGNGLVLPCQKQRYADPRGVAAWVRYHRDGPRRNAARTVVQTAEASASPRAARATFDRVRRWVSGCEDPGVFLYSTAVSPGLGDDAAVFRLQDTAAQVTYVVGVARTGLFTTAVSLRTDAPPGRADEGGVANALAAAVDRLCRLPDGGTCARMPAVVEAAPPFPTGQVPALLSAVDLPPVGVDNGPWVGTEPRQITGTRSDILVVGCSDVTFTGSFAGARFRANVVRTFVLPESRLPTEFGLTQTVAVLPDKAATALVARVRDDVSRCPEQDTGAGTEVERIGVLDERGRSFTAWHLETALPDDRMVEYDVAVLRNGEAVSQLLFVTTGDARIDHSAFVGVVRRALERLGEHPPYRKAG